MVKTQNVDTELLDLAIAKSGLKTNFIVDKLGISRQAYNKKRLGKSAFRQSEVYCLCTLLGLDETESTKIFFPEKLG